MTNPLLGQPEPRSTSLVRFGVILQSTSGALTLNVDGVEQPARWLQEYSPTLGDKVAFVVTRDALGQSSNLVVGRVGETRAVRPDEGVVTAVAAPWVTVLADGVSYQAKIAGTAPIVGDRMLLEHRPTVIYAVAKVTATTAPTPVIPTTPLPPLSSAKSGVERFASTDSRTALAYGAWSIKDGKSVIQGTYAGVTYAGSWFLGTGPAWLSAVTVTGFRVYLPARLRIGAFDASATFGLYATNATEAGETDPARVVGPTNITLPAGWGGGWVTLPNTYATQIIAGGGLGIEGTALAGFVGRDIDPMSGASEFTWTT